MDQTEFNALSDVDKWRAYRDASEQRSLLLAESANLVEALFYISTTTTFAGDTALKRSYRDLQQTAHEALQADPEGKAFLARLKAAEAVCGIAERSEDMFEEDLGQALAAWRKVRKIEGK